MKLTLLTLILLTISTNTLPSQSADEAAIRENVKQMETGWNKKDGALFAQPFAEDADYVVINGQHLKGREVIDSSHQHIFDTIYKETTVDFKVQQIRFLRPDVAVVHVSSSRTGPTPELKHNAFFTLVMTKEGKRWTIAAFQNTSVARQ